MPEPFKSIETSDPWPQPRHFAFVAGAWALLVVYGSLTPFSYQPMEWGRAAAILRWIVENPPQKAPRSDWATNFLLLVPLGFAALAALLVDRDSLLRRGIGVALVLCGGLLLSVSVEAAQLWFPPRHPAKADVIAQTLGNAVGMGVWILTGQPLTDWTRRRVRGPRGGRVVWLLSVYALGLLVYSLLPLDLTIRPHELWNKYKSGLVHLVPFGQWRPDAASLLSAAREVAMLWPIGTLAAVWPRQPRAERSLLRRWLAGLAFVGLIEFLQLFLRTRHSDMTDLVLGAIGISGGFGVALVWDRNAAASRWSAGLRIASLVGFAVLLAAIYLEPLELLSDHGAALERAAAMFRVPLEALRQGDVLQIVSNVGRKLLLFGVLGWLAAENARLVRRDATTRGLIACGLVAGGIASAAIEIAQGWFPRHVPDVTDVLWGAAGGALGAYAGRFVESEAAKGTE